MKKVINCLKHDNPVINKKLKEVSIEEGMEIAAELFNILNERKDGIGLAANQVGIDAAVAVVNVREPIVLINPKVIDAHDEVNFVEGCLSFPGKSVITTRFETVQITSANVEGTLLFSGCEIQPNAKGSWEDDEHKEDRELRMLESICVQHEIDHLNGLVCMDRKRDITVRAVKKPGRNDICPCDSGKKYKKCCLNIK